MDLEMARVTDRLTKRLAAWWASTRVTPLPPSLHSPPHRHGNMASLWWPAPSQCLRVIPRMGGWPARPHSSWAPRSVYMHIKCIYWKVLFNSWHKKLFIVRSVSHLSRRENYFKYDTFVTDNVRFEAWNVYL